MQPHSTTRRDHHRRIIARDQPPCGICGEPIDYSLPHLHPKSFVVDHIVPRSRFPGGPEAGADELANKQAAHRDCNRAKSDKLPGEERRPTTGTGYHYETWRTWKP